MKIIREIECYLADSDELIFSFELTNFSLDKATCEWEIGDDKMMYDMYEIKSKNQMKLIEKYTKGIKLNF